LVFESSFEFLKVMTKSSTCVPRRQALKQQTLRQPAPHQQVPDQVEVTLLLSGGQQYTLSVPTSDLLLRQLFEVVMDWEGKRDRRLFQIPIEQGRSMLTFPCDRLIGVITHPPLIIQQPVIQQPVIQQPVIQQPTQPIAATQPSALLTANFVQLDNFLPPAQHRRLLQYVLQRKASFVSTSTSMGDLDYRRSIVLYDLPEFAAQITQQIQAVLPDVSAQLGLMPFPLGQIETQITAHNDGNYYKIHNDNGSPETASRELTYVYYFTREPKAFSGGELWLYDGRLENNFFVRAESFRTIEPRNNSIVFFLSRYMHEVLPVQCPSKTFANGRFTVNGWVRRAS
jgi:SM-20-related protein